jgi:hypothetical protein
MIKLKILPLLTALYLSIACTTTMANFSPKHQTRIKERIISANYDTVFNVMMDVLVEDGYKIKKRDKKNGVIKTDSKLKHLIFASWWNPAGSHWRSISVYLKKNDLNSTNLILNILAEEAEFFPFMDWEHNDNLVNPHDYDKLFMLIESRARQTNKK